MQTYKGVHLPMTMVDYETGGPNSVMRKRHYLNYDSHHNRNYNIFEGGYNLQFTTPTRNRMDTQESLKML